MRVKQVVMASALCGSLVGGGALASDPGNMAGHWARSSEELAGLEISNGTVNPSDTPGTTTLIFIPVTVVLIHWAEYKTHGHVVEDSDHIEPESSFDPIAG